MNDNSTKRYELILFEQTSRRMRGMLLLLALTLFVIGLYDLAIRPILGGWGFLLWLVMIPVWAFWYYYAILVRRGAILLTPEHLVLQGPRQQIRISYGRFATVTSVKFEQHFPRAKLSRAERARLKPLYERTAICLELYSFPPKFEEQIKQFPRYLRSQTRQGLLLSVDDWMALSRDLEARKIAWHAKHDKRHQQADKQSPASRPLDD